MSALGIWTQSKVFGSVAFGVMLEVDEDSEQMQVYKTDRCYFVHGVENDEFFT